MAGKKKATSGDMDAAAGRGKDSSSAAPPLNDKIGGNAPLNDKIGGDAPLNDDRARKTDRSAKAAKGGGAKKGKARMNPREKKFAERWMVHFNATKAATEAGYSQRSAASIGYELLRKPKIQEYIRTRLRAQDSAYVADADEAMAFNTAVMRGEVKDQFGLDASLSDRLKASEAIAKRAIAAESAGAGAGVTVEYFKPEDEEDAK